MRNRIRDKIWSLKMWYWFRFKPCKWGMEAGRVIQEGMIEGIRKGMDKNDK